MKVNLDSSFKPFKKVLIPYENIQNDKCKQDKAIKRLSINLIKNFQSCDNNFFFDISLVPKRILTIPGIGVNNDGFDNINNDYILRVHDIIIHYDKDKQIKSQYIIIDLVGQGTFGQVVKCENEVSKEIVAIKVIKNKPAYFQQGKIEIKSLQQLNFAQNQLNSNKIVQMKDFFVYRKHIFLVFEILSYSLYDVLLSSNYEGISLYQIQSYTKQILEGLKITQQYGIIHCDLKPENILLQNKQKEQIKIIDFGSSCQETNLLYNYIQSRFYRAPEVIYGLQYTMAIDIWSLGNIYKIFFKKKNKDNQQTQQ